MTRLTVVIGAVLVVLGVVAYVMTAAASVTALIPTFVGVLLLLCAAAARKPAWHRHGIHAALVVALVGALGTLMNVVRIGEVFAGTAERPAAVVVSTLMFVLLVGYLVMGIRSFVAARRANTSG
ncbi:hypothetical protein [Pseudonocardia kunmingensis]|nr:hypothetical protein [Pseudonocardia kunmingensis]